MLGWNSPKLLWIRGGKEGGMFPALLCRKAYSPSRCNFEYVVPLHDQLGYCCFSSTGI
jgi:hypothetical protein